MSCRLLGRQNERKTVLAEIEQLERVKGIWSVGEVLVGVRRRVFVGERDKDDKVQQCSTKVSVLC
jgi:hypothetical protein